MSAAGRCAVQDKKAASPLTPGRLPRSRPGDAPRRVRGRPSGLKAAAHRLPATAPPGPALTPETTAAPPAGNKGRPQPARPPARRVRCARAQRTHRRQEPEMNWRSILRRTDKTTRIR